MCFGKIDYDHFVFLSGQCYLIKSLDHEPNFAKRIVKPPDSNPTKRRSDVTRKGSQLVNSLTSQDICVSKLK
jgi:hypothetical protein